MFVPGLDPAEPPASGAALPGAPGQARHAQVPSTEPDPAARGDPAPAIGAQPLGSQEGRGDVGHQGWSGTIRARTGLTAGEDGGVVGSPAARRRRGRARSTGASVISMRSFGVHSNASQMAARVPSESRSGRWATRRYTCAGDSSMPARPAGAPGRSWPTCPAGPSPPAAATGTRACVSSTLLWSGRRVGEAGGQCPLEHPVAVVAPDVRVDRGRGRPGVFDTRVIPGHALVGQRRRAARASR